jgi:hypothetical protein
MRRSEELIVLVVLLLGTVAFVLWYVVDRRAQQRNNPATEPRAIGPVATPATPGGAAAPSAPAPATAGPLDFEKVDGKTLDLSSGRPVLKDSPADRAAMDAALKEMEEASRDVSFESPKQKDPARK